MKILEMSNTIKNGTKALLLGSFWSMALLGTMASAMEVGATTTIDIDGPVHFLAVDGSDALVLSGTYQVEAAETWLRLVPGERRDAILLDAEGIMHQEAIAEPAASLTSVDNDTQEIVLFLPDGTGLKALGAYSGVMSRGVVPGKQTNALAPRSPPATSSPKSTPRAQERQPRVMNKQKEGGSGVPNVTPDDPWDKALLGLILQQGQTIRGLQAEIKGLQAKVEKINIHEHEYKLGVPGTDGLWWTTLRDLRKMQDDEPHPMDDYSVLFGHRRNDGKSRPLHTSEPKY